MKVGVTEVTNPLELIKIIMAFDSRDWMADYRDRMLYAIVFGIDREEEVDYLNKGWTQETINEYKRFHLKYIELLELGDKKYEIKQ